ncbi:MAG TPA: divalent metal cation transporter [Solirubrobacteraceae bacterium]
MSDVDRLGGPMNDPTAIAMAARGWRPGWTRALWVLGPGLMVMLADTDAGSVVTAAQSGASWGYRLLPLELVLIPVLYLVMELTVRLGITTGKGHAEAIRDRFGTRWAALSVGTLLLSATGALITEFAGIAGVGELVGLAPAVTVPLAAAFLIAIVLCRGYRRVELIGLTLGMFEVAFVLAAVLARPKVGAIADSLWTHQPVTDHGYLALVAANVGAVVMPWMIFCQQGAVVDKGLRARHIRLARLDTALGAVLTQLIMAAVLIVTAATLSGHGAGRLTSVGEISTALTPYLGAFASRLTFALGIAGAALLASIVVSLAAAWAVAEAFGARRSLNDGVRGAPLFYGLYLTCIAVGAGMVLASNSLIRLAIDVEILNALLLPLVVGLLLALAWTTLPHPHRLRRGERVVLAAVLGTLTLVGLGWATVTVLPGSPQTACCAARQSMSTESARARRGARIGAPRSSRLVSRPPSGVLFGSALGLGGS